MRKIVNKVSSNLRRIYMGIKMRQRVFRAMGNRMRVLGLEICVLRDNDRGVATQICFKYNDVALRD